MVSGNTSFDIWQKNKQCIPGGLVFLNRKTEPPFVFVRVKGAYLWDINGKVCTDYHAAFSPTLLCHNDPDVNSAVIQSLESEESLMVAGAILWEEEFANL
jgi:glutamate-1-semialdehyde 2,1-aminomutase